MNKITKYIYPFLFILFFIGGMFNSFFQYLGVFPLLGIAIYLFIKIRNKIKNKHLLIYFILLSLISLSFFLGYHNILDYHDFIKEAQKYWGSFLLFFAGFILIKTKKVSINSIISYFLSGIFLTTAYGLVELIINLIKQDSLKRLSTPLGICNNYASILIIGILILFYKIINKKYFINKTADYIGLIFFAISLFLTQSLGAIVGLILTISIYLFFKNRKVKLVNSLIFILILFIVFTTTFIMFKKSILDSSNRQRLGLINGYSQIIKKHPLQGVGLNQTELYYDKWKTIIPYQEEIKYVDKRDAHNFIIQWITENGIISFIILLTFFIYYFKNNFKKYNPSYGILLGIIAFLVHALFSNNFHIIRLMMYFWFLLGSFDALEYKKRE